MMMINDVAGQRQAMVEHQIAARGVADERVLEAMRTVPREMFVPQEVSEFAYQDTPLPIAEGQTISQPYIVARRAEMAEVGPRDRVLEIGTGSGYGAAILSRIAREVYTIERHRGLALAAERRIRELGCDTVHIRHGDGTLGWRDAAPFDAIIVTARGSSVPPALRRQLSVGGRLVIPVGERGAQRLLRVRRAEEDRYDEEDLGWVTFVPLVGSEGWQPEHSETGTEPAAPHPAAGKSAGPAAKRGPVQLIADAREPLPDLSDPAFGALFARAGDARVVLLGEASHGTSEFYRARTRITQQLIREHGFTIVAVEADWPDAAQVDGYVRDRAFVPVGERPFMRFPTWMWRNTDVRAFVDWLREYNNSSADYDRKVGFYGLDLYSMYGSIAAVLNYLDKIDPDAARVARERYGCPMPWQSDPVTYGRAALSSRYADCEKEVSAMLDDLLRRRLDYVGQDGESFVDAAQNARLIANAERYYKVMYYGGAESWNLRDTHMFETLQSVLAARGPGAKAVVWAHNFHIGNAAATEMGIHRRELNVGQLCREHFGLDAVLIGFDTDHGTVAAASDWDGPMEIKSVRPLHMIMNLASRFHQSGHR